VRIFRELGARLDLARAEESLAGLGYELPPASAAETQHSQLSIRRLVEAVNSRELMLRELASLLRQEAGAARVLVLEPSEGVRYRAAGEQGFAHEEGPHLLASLNAAASEEDAEGAASKQGGALVHLRVGNAAPAALFVSPRTLVDAADESLTTLLRLAEIGLDLCAFRERARQGRDGAQRSSLAEQGLMPGFIHSSPSMKLLVEEIQKIRSSDVTVLVTGDSGTGKELVARAEDGAVVTPEHLSPDIQRTAPRLSAPTHSAVSTLTPGVSLSDAVEDLERGMIAEALRRHNGNVTRAARDLGLTRRGLQLKLGRYQIAATA
jgi:transcriptional regulator with GAF, ATPase, and Fis domain